MDHVRGELHLRCGACGNCAGRRPPSRAWWLVVVPAWAALLFVGACSAIMLPLNLVLVPAWFACALSLGTLARRARSPSCRACGEWDGSWSAAPEVAGGLARPADERAVERALVGEAHQERDLRDGARELA
jgi:hypothetical protein